MELQNYLYQVSHLLDNLETPDSEEKKVIKRLQKDIHEALGHALKGEHLEVTQILDCISPVINALVVNIGEEDTQEV